MPAIERLVSYIAVQDPAFPKAIQGASEEEIAKLESAAGTSLPAVYREFLERMGRGMDWLRPTAAVFDVLALTRYFESEPWRPAAGYLKIGLGQNDAGFDVYLEPGGPAGPRVIMMPRGPVENFEAAKKAWRTPLAGSLPQYLGTAAYRTLRLDQWPEQVRVVTDVLDERLILKLNSYSPVLSLRQVWFSNDWVQVFDSEDAGLVATQFPNAVLALDIAARESGRLHAIRTYLQPKLGLKRMVTSQTSEG